MVIIVVARVGGILAKRDHSLAFLYDNQLIEANVINAAHENSVQDLISLEAVTIS